jgi:hypothetical protein
LGSFGCFEVLFLMIRRLQYPQKPGFFLETKMHDLLAPLQRDDARPLHITGVLGAILYYNSILEIFVNLVP